jgi:hypothetical protein
VGDEVADPVDVRDLPPDRGLGRFVGPAAPALPAAAGEDVDDARERAAGEAPRPVRVSGGHRRRQIPEVRRGQPPAGRPAADHDTTVGDRVGRVTDGERPHHEPPGDQVEADEHELDDAGHQIDGDQAGTGGHEGHGPDPMV